MPLSQSSCQAGCFLVQVDRVCKTKASLTYQNSTRCRLLSACATLIPTSQCRLVVFILCMPCNVLCLKTWQKWKEWQRAYLSTQAVARACDQPLASCWLMPLKTNSRRPACSIQHAIWNTAGVACLGKKLTRPATNMSGMTYRVQCFAAVRGIAN